MSCCKKSSAYEEEEEYEEEGSEDDEDASDPRVEALSQNGLRLDQIDVLELLTKNSKYLSRLTDAKKPKGSGHASCIEQCGKAASDEWIKKLSMALQSNTYLTELSFGRGHQLSETGLQTLTDALGASSALNKLALTFGTPGIRAAGCEAMSDWLGKNSQLTILDLTSNDIGDAGVTAIGKALASGVTIVKTLMLTTNNIGPQGGIALADVLSRESALTSLTLADNELGDDGVTSIAEALKTNTTLYALMLDSNRIKSAGAIAIANSLKVNASLTRLSFESHTLLHESSQFNDIGDDGTHAFADMLKTNKSLRFLNLNDAGTHAESVRALATAIEESNETLLSCKTAPNMDPMVESSCKRNMVSHRAGKKWLRRSTTHTS